MASASCSWPVWRVDDFTVCFQRDYLKFAFPIAILLTSVVIATHQILLRVARLKRKNSRRGDYQQIRDRLGSHSSALGRTELPVPASLDSDDDDETSASLGPNASSAIDDEEADDGLLVRAGSLDLVRTVTKGSVVEASKPVCQDFTLLFEVVAVAGLVVVNLVALVKGAFTGHGADDAPDSRGRNAAIVGLVIWIYTFALVALRVLVTKSHWRMPHLWNHTACIYSAQWLFTMCIFRSVVIHATARLTLLLVSIEFALTSLLFFIAITTRKGNKTVLIEYEDGLPPSRENLSSILSHYTFTWVDQIMWEGYKQPLEMDRIWNLNPEDKAGTVLARYRQAKKTLGLAAHMLLYFKGDLFEQAWWAVMSGVFTFAPTMLLKAILEYVEHPDDAPRNVLWLYVILLPVTDLIRSFGDNRALWIGRKVCINIRAILVGEIYAKALRRKAAAGNETVLGSKDAAKDAAGAATDGRESWMATVKRKLGLKKKSDDNGVAAAAAAPAAPAAADAAKDPKSADEQANIGTIINLMSVDSFKVSEVTAYLHFLVASAPTQLLVSVILLYRVMGLSAIPGFVIMAMLLPVNIGFAKAFHSTQKVIMAATDKRIQATNEILQNIRIVKYFAWELRFGNIVDEKRRAELLALRRRYMIWACAVATWNTVPILITFCCFLVYTIVEGKPLYPSVAFTAISLFMLLRYPLDQLGDMIAHVQESQVSIDRIEEFLAEEETEKFEQLGLDNIDETTGARVIGLRNNASFIWGAKDAVANDGTMAFRLLDINVDFEIGKLNIVTGPTGSGKTSLLMALLGEMTLLSGRVYLPGGRSREDVRSDPETGLAETCAYVAQQAWLVNGTIKENILFSSPFDEQRYRDVIVACALERDIHETLDNGDDTLVGEKGITLSGGQKQRISLARALYSNSRHLLLDDCLSAVDSHTAQWIFNNCIRGPLMRSRTCILVTHNISLCVPFSDHVIIMDNGRITAQGPSQDVIASGKLGESVVHKSQTGASDISRIPSRVPSSVGDGDGEHGDSETLIDNGGAADPSLPSAGSNGSGKNDKNNKDKKSDKKPNAMDEEKATGSVKWSVMLVYLQSMGPWWFWVVAVLVFSSQQFSLVASNLWIKEWSNQYAEDLGGNKTAVIAALRHNATAVLGSLAGGQTPLFSRSLSQVFSPSTVSHITSIPQQWMPKDSVVLQSDTALQALLTPQVNSHYYIAVLAVIGLLGAAFAFVRDLWIFFGSLTASWKLHNDLMHSVSFARFKFFDVTPLGQMMNRFSKDLEAVDQEVAPVAISVMTCGLGIIITIVLIASITPGFLIAGVFITALYVVLGKFYLGASRDLKRLESVQRSPLFQQFGETLSGVTTIRAYGDERRFVRDNLTRINDQLRPFLYLWAANRWLAFRTDLLGDLVSFSAGVFVILSVDTINAGSAGISLSYAIGFAENILWLVRLYAMNEQNMNSVERIKEYLDVEQEAAPIVEDNRPPANWPSQGSVEFIDYTTRYRAELDPVLRNLTFRIAPREKVGIVGRTGAGKSSLALALFRALEAETGKILIDGMDIGLIGLRDLRESLTIVPQEPTLFMGTIRTNLDPFDAYTDEQIFAALRRVQLIGPGESPAESPAASPTESSSADVAADAPATNKNVFLDLSSTVAESGTNLSQGQRQLLCLARALLKKPSILLMDEATASIDYATDSKIQETLRELTSTIITIAHRLQTIADYDKVLVLDRGSLVEYGHPWELMTKADGVFRSMCDMSGDYELLLKVARKAYEAKHEHLIETE